MREGTALTLKETIRANLGSTAYDTVAFWQILETLQGLWERKEKAYGRSWAKRGIIGYWTGCIGRQIDRIDPGFARLVDLMSSGADDRNTLELRKVVVSIMGTLADVANYAMMGVCLLASIFPEAYDEWKVKIEAED